MASKEAKEKILIKDSESNEVYTILVTADEIKRLGTDLVFATTKLNEAKNEKQDDNTIINEIHDVAESLHSDPNENVGVFKWPHEAILLLIEEYNSRRQDFVSGKMSQKKIWSLIANELKKHGHNVTGLQCLSKFSGLKRTYNSIKDNKRSEPSTWPYFSNMDELLNSNPSMTASSRRKTKACSECSTSSLDSCFEDDKPVHKKSRQMSTVVRYMEDLRHERKKSEEAIERRHKENVELRHRFLHSFEKMLNILEKK